MYHAWLAVYWDIGTWCECVILIKKIRFQMQRCCFCVFNGIMYVCYVRISDGWPTNVLNVSALLSQKWNCTHVSAKLCCISLRSTFVSPFFTFALFVVAPTRLDIIGSIDAVRFVGMHLSVFRANWSDTLHKSWTLFWNGTTYRNK